MVFFRLAGKETLEVVRILHQRMEPATPPMTGRPPRPNPSTAAYPLL
ncbi:hypothetical protein [Xanthobacter sp. 126]|nr:hypothetical protein [Xanthobacter sp. 126]